MSNTYKQLARDAKTATLLVHPGEPNQRATRKALEDRPDQMANAVRKTREKYPDADLAWLLPDGELVPVIS